MIVLDTSASIELISPREKGEKIKKILENDTAAITTITQNELLIGAKNDKEIIEQFLQSVIILPFDAESSYKSVEIEHTLSKEGKMIGKLDIFIASICLAYGIPVLTLDEHFKRVKGLNIIPI